MTACFETETHKELIQENWTKSRASTLEQQGPGIYLYNPLLDTEFAERRLLSSNF